MPKHHLILEHKWALGDTILLSALVRDIHLAYPDQYEISVDTHFKNLWSDNPHIVPINTGGQRIKIRWGDAIKQHSFISTRDGKKVMRHILAWYHHDFELKTGLRVPVSSPRADVHLPAKLHTPLISGRYWVVIAGGKNDLTNKQWRYSNYQEVVDQLTAQGLQFVQCGSTVSKHNHPALTNCLNLIGQTEDARDFCNIIRFAEGVICPVTAAMHLAGAFERPCVVLAGGREEPWFEAYVNEYRAFGENCPHVRTPHKFLHTLGLLSCCDKVGCWKNRTVPLEARDLTKKKELLCKDPVRLPDGGATPACLDLITPTHVVEAVMDYYQQGTLPPIRPLAPRPEPKIEIQPPPEIHVDPNTLLTPRSEKPQLLRAPSSPPKPQRESQRGPQREYQGDSFSGKANQLQLLDHPVIGGKFTVCVLCYGDHLPLAQRCINSILSTLPRERMDLRIGANAVSGATLQFLQSVKPDKLYAYSENKKKYPLMREMFWDAQAPLATKYLLWFDDDAYAIDPAWPTRLAETIVNHHAFGGRLYGWKMFHDLSMYAKQGHRPDHWFREASWYKGAPFRVRGQDRYAPNGSCLDFVAGWFWAIGVDAIRAAGVPDQRLNHNGGDCCIGEQVHQAGYKLIMFNKNKCFVSCPAKDQGGRRGFSEAFPWADAKSRAEHILGR